MTPAMCLARMLAPKEHPLLVRSESGQLVYAGIRPAASAMSFGEKLANFDWPPPPSPASAIRPMLGTTGSLLGGTGDLDLSESGSISLGSNDMRNRGELWEMRSEIQREKLKRVAPFPFFGCTMRFSDDYSALQIAEDGRFSYSEVSLEMADPEASPNKTKAVDVRRVVTYEGVFTGPYTPTADEDEQQVGKKKSPRKSDAMRSTGMGKGKDTSTEEPSSTQADPELAAIEASALVKHEMVESGGRSRLVRVERGGNWGFAITVSPFFHPSHAIVKVLVRCAPRGHPPARGRRLPYVGTGLASSKSTGTAKRDAHSSIVGGMSADLRPRKRAGGLVKSRSDALLPSAPGPWAGSTTSSTFRRAGAGSLRSGGHPGSHRKLGGCASSPQLRSMHQSDSDWMVF